MNTLASAVTVRIEAGGDAQGARVAAHFRSLDDRPDESAPISIGEPSVVALFPGSYLLEVVMPSGERLRKPLEVRAAREEVSLSVSPSPHEWLAVPHLLVDRRRLTGRPASAAPVPEPWVAHFHEWPAAVSPDGLRGAVRAKRPLTLSGGTAIPPRSRDAAISRFDLLDGAPAREPEDVGAVVIGMGDRSVVIPIPVDWSTLEGRRVHTEVVVNADRQSVSSTIADPEFAPVLAYLAGGRREDARIALTDRAIDLLHGKVRNPFAAAAGAYVLVDDLEDAARAPGWRWWIRNLSSWFPRLADGAILEGRALLHAGQEKQALSSFLEAHRRGLPFYTEGLRMLLDGLLSFDPREVPDAAEAIRDVREWSTWADPRESFLTLRLPLALDRSVTR